MADPNSKNEDPTLLKITIKANESKELKFKTEIHDHENLLKSLKIDIEYYIKKYKSLNKKKTLLIVAEFLIGSASTISSSTLAVLNPSAGNISSSSTALLTSIAILITNEYISNIKTRHTKLRNWIKIFTLPDEKTLKTTMVDKKIDENEAEELKKIYKHNLDKGREIMKNTSFKVEDIIGDVLSKISISPEQVTKLINSLAKIL